MLTAIAHKLLCLTALRLCVLDAVSYCTRRILSLRERWRGKVNAMQWAWVCILVCWPLHWFFCSCPSPLFFFCQNCEKSFLPQPHSHTAWKALIYLWALADDRSLHTMRHVLYPDFWISQKIGALLCTTISSLQPSRSYLWFSEIYNRGYLTEHRPHHHSLQCFTEKLISCRSWQYTSIIGNAVPSNGPN